VTAGTTTGNSDRARRQDLARWGRILRQLTGQDVDETAQLEIDTDLAGLTPATLSVENLLEALEVLRRRYKSSTLSRSISTLRSFCRWLVNRGHLASNPFDDDILMIRHRTSAEVRAFSEADVDAMLDAAATPPPSASSAWPTRDVAAVDVLAFTGVRAAEFCGLQIGDVGTTDRPILYIRRGAKGNKRREVPLPRHSTDRLEAYLAERAEHGIRSGGRTELFVRNDGRAMSTDSLYHLIKRVALAAGINLPDDALVHGLRHHFGVQLALRGVPPATLQQLMGHSDPRTTALYTRHASRDLVNALDDAGWLTN
jgi:site-specific recombinase XerD